MTRSIFYLSGKTIAAAVAAAAISVLFCQDVLAQFPSLLNSGNRSKRDSSVPTTVTAITMDFDMENNIITLLGDVVVDDPEITIECNRMKIFLEEKSDSGTSANTPTEENIAESSSASSSTENTDIPPSAVSSSTDESAETQAGNEEEAENTSGSEDMISGGGKQIDRIECLGDVVITRKPAPDETPDQEQRATAGKAVYFYKDSIIELTEKPVIYTQDKKISGRTITINLNQGGRIRLTHGTIVDYEQTSAPDTENTRQ